MAIQTACPSCGKNYRAADNMAGRRVRCRGCGEVFPLDGGPASAPGPGGYDPSAVARNAATPAGGLSPDAADAFRIPPAAHNPLDVGGGTDADAEFAHAFAEYRPLVRPNYGHNFPYAGLLDRWLPAGLAALSLVWLVAQVLGSNDAGVGWAVPLRLALAGLGFLVVVFPLGWLGMSLGCKYARFQRPPDPAKRVVAATLFPYVLLLVIWMMVGSLGGAVPGVVVALIVVTGLAWLVYRPAPEESAVSLGAAGGAFLVGVVACGMLAVGVNEAARSIARSGKRPTQLAASPVGPGLAWDAPPAAEPEKKAKPGSPAADGGEPPADPSGDPPADPPVQPQASTPPIVAGPANLPATTRAAAGAVAGGTPPAGPDPMASSPLFRRPDAGASAVPLPPDAPTPSPTAPEPPAPEPPDVAAAGPVAPPVPAPTAGGPRPAGGPPAVAPTGDVVGDRIRAARSSLVAEVRALGAIPPFAGAVSPLTPSPMVLVTRPDPAGGGEVGEIWDLTRFERVAAGPLPQGGTAATLALSPDGKALARVTNFPTHGVELMSFGAAAPPTHVPFPTAGPNFVSTATAQPQVVGFGLDGRVLVRWSGAGQVGLQVLDVRTKKYGNLLELPAHVPGPGNQAMSPDGRYYAVVGEAADRAGGPKSRTAATVDLAFIKVVKKAVAGVDPQWQPSGVSFSADGRRLCVLFEQSGSTIVLTPNVESARPIIVPPGKVPAVPEGAPPTAGRLLPLADGRSWLIGGNAVVDAESGKLTGVIGLDRPMEVSAFGDAVVLRHGEPGARKLVLVKLSPLVAPKPAAPAPAGRPMAAPASRGVSLGART